jgi:S-formylglutathione hydrolase FrmB
MIRAAVFSSGFVCFNTVAICELHFSSPSLQKQTACNVIIPEVPGFNGPYPVFYLLHGLSDDYTMWQRKTSIGRYAQMLPMMIVMPDAGAVSTATPRRFRL